MGWSALFAGQPHFIGALSSAAAWNLLAHGIDDVRQALRQPEIRIPIAAHKHSLRQCYVSGLETAGSRTQRSARGCALAGQNQHCRHHRLWPKSAQHIRREKVLRHARGGRRCQAIDADVVLLSFNGQCLHQADERHFGCAIVAMAEIAVKAARWVVIMMRPYFCATINGHTALLQCTAPIR